LGHNNELPVEALLSLRAIGSTLVILLLEKGLSGLKELGTILENKAGERRRKGCRTKLKMGGNFLSWGKTRETAR